MTSHVTRSEAETSALGRALGRRLSAGDVVLLAGPLGAGKTAFVRGLAEGLGCAADEVSSPTFTLVQEYRGGRLPLVHVDLYRLDDARGYSISSHTIAHRHRCGRSRRRPLNMPENKSGSGCCGMPVHPCALFCRGAVVS